MRDGWYHVTPDGNIHPPGVCALDPDFGSHIGKMFVYVAHPVRIPKARAVRVNRRPGFAVDYNTLTGLGLFYHIGCPKAWWGIISCPCGAKVPDPNEPRGGGRIPEGS